MFFDWVLRLAETGGASHNRVMSNERDEFWRRFGAEPPEDAPGGPPVDVAALRAYVSLEASPERLQEIRRCLVKYAAWRAAYSEILRESDEN